jgi:hypothetical protein
VTRCRLTLALFLASELTAAAQQTVHGVVRDAQDRGVAGADLVWSCADRTSRARTADDGVFSFSVADGSGLCDLTVRRTGFAEWHRTVPAVPAPLTITLAIAPLRETVNVAATLDKWDLSAAGTSARRSAADLQPLGSDSRVWLDVIMNDAGAFVGQRRIYIDGLPVDAAPDAARIGSIAVNADPFSAEYGGTDQNRVDISSVTPDRHWRFNAGGPSWIQGGSDRLVSRPAPDRRQRVAGISGPVPRLPITFFVQGSTFASTDYPTYVAVQPAGGSLAAAAAASTLEAWSTGIDVSRSGVAWHAAVDASNTRLENTAVGGLTAPDAGLHSMLESRRMLSSWTTTGKAVRHRGGLLIVRSATESSAIAAGQARTVFGQLHVSGVDVLADAAVATRLDVRHTIDGINDGRAWSAGVQLSHSRLRDSPVPNPFGRLELESPGASTGTLIIQRGLPALRVTDTTGALFLQGTAVERQHLLLRAGARGDWQSGEGLLLSPRMTLLMRGAGFIAAARAGLFVEPWSPALLLEVQRRDGIGLETRVIPGVASAAGDLTVLPGQGEPLSARFDPAAARRRDGVVETLIARGFGRFAASVDHKWTRGMSLAGAMRSRTPAGLVDVIDTDRRLARHQLHLRAGMSAGAVAVTAHYEFVRSADDADDPFALPARQGDIAGEWGPSTGVAAHHASLVATLSLPASIRAFVSATAASGSPYSSITGRDLDRWAVFTDRGGAPRNSLTGPRQRSVSVYASRRVTVARARGLAFDVGVRAENVFDWTNVTAVGAVAGSGWAGLPLAALAGRTLNVWASIAR